MLCPRISFAVLIAVSLGFLAGEIRGEDIVDSPESDWKQFLASPEVDKADRPLLQRLSSHLEVRTFRQLEQRERETLLRYADIRFANKLPVARCWAPTTPRLIRSAYHAVEEAARAEISLQKANQFFRRWNYTATNGPGQNVQGNPITLTWSIVPDGTPIPGDAGIGDADGPSDLRARLGELYGGDTGPPHLQPWFPIIEAIFANITAKTGINYVYEPADDAGGLGPGQRGELGVRGDVRLGGHRIDGDGRTLAYNYFPDAGDMVIDTSDNWFEDLRDDSVRLANTIEHEHGHGLGMEHVCPDDETKLMEPFINTRFRGLQFDDIYTLQRWYGDPLEHHGALRDNDRPEKATELPLQVGEFFASEWLSIDDNSDVDCYSLALQGGVRLNARVLPSSDRYTEGPQLSGGTCANGALFEHDLHHDLTLELVGPDQSTVLASANENPAGELEEILDFIIPSTGVYYLRVTGGEANLAQLYRLEADLALLPVALEVVDHGVVAESFAPANGLVEPGETVRWEVTLVNNGSRPVGGVFGTLTGPEGFTGFEVAGDFGTLLPQQPVSRSFVFALDGDCGAAIPLELNVAADEGLQEGFVLPFSLGERVANLEQSFDAGSGNELPVGWTTSSTGEGSGWKRDARRFHTARYSFFAEDRETGAGTSALISPPVVLGASGLTLRFHHYFDLEASSSDPERGYDGGVLEMSIEDGPWGDVLDAGAIFLEGGYNRTLFSGFDNPLPGPAWSGRSEEWISTVVQLPDSLAGAQVRFRWLLGHDRTDAEEGWFIDTIQVSAGVCADTAPAVMMSVEDNTASEFSPFGGGRLVFSVPLPSAVDLAIPLLNSGTASLATDVSGLEEIVLPAGQTSVEAIVQAVNDSEVEGDESLVLTIDPAAGLVVQGDPLAILTVADTPYGQWAATVLGLGTPNGPFQDRDEDGSLNLEEYAWQTDGNSPFETPRLTPRMVDGYLRVDGPFATLPGDVILGAETSTDLRFWRRDEVESLVDGFRVRVDEKSRFLRLVYELIPAAP